MTRPQLNRISGIALTVFSLIALFTVLSGYVGTPPPPHADEGAAAHIFQLSVVVAVGAFLFFVTTTDWRRPWRAFRWLGFPAVVLATAFIALYHLEHYH